MESCCKLINEQRKRKFGEQAQQPTVTEPQQQQPLFGVPADSPQQDSSLQQPIIRPNQASIFPTLTQARAPGPVDPSLLGDNPVTAALNAQIANRRG